MRMDLGEVGWRDVDWIGLSQDRDRWGALVSSVLNLRVPVASRVVLSSYKCMPAVGSTKSSIYFELLQLVLHNSCVCHHCVL
jgi:hypothetical protein